MVEGVSGEVTAPAVPEISEAQTTPEAKPQEDEFSDKFIKLTRQKRALEQQASELKAERARIEAERKEIEEFRNSKAKIKQNPKEALSTLGVSFDDLAHMILTEGREPTEADKLSAIEAKIKAMEEAEEKKKQEAIESERQKTVSLYRTNLEKFVESSDYELIKTFGATEDVFETIQEWYDKTLQEKGEGVILSYSDACAMVEEHYEKLLEKAAQTNKAKSKFGSFEEKLQSQAEVNTPKGVAPSTTLTNAMKAVSEPATPSHRRPSNEELRQAAAAMIKWTN